MTIHVRTWTTRQARRLFLGLLLVGLSAAIVPAASLATISTFGSPLAVPATLNTSENLSYYGTYTPVPPNPEAPNGVFHTAHNGADTALWNVAGAPVTGQAVKLRLEGCAQQAAGGPEPITQVHFQDVTPIADGGVKINLTSQAFNIPVCGQNGASGATISTYEPVNLCVSQGDYVAFNDEGGYVENVYRSGVPYQVIGALQGSTLDSFIRGNGTNNGATLSGKDTTANDGFSSNPGEELMLQVIEGSGADATHICAGGTAGKAAPLPALKVRPQTEGVDHSHTISVAVYCRPVSGCSGNVDLSVPGKHGSYGHAGFSVPGNKTSHVTVRVSSLLIRLLRRRHGISVLVTAEMGGVTFSQPILVKIL